MAALDWVFATALVASVLLGAWRGLMYELLSVLGWIGAFVLAQWLAPQVGGWLPMGRAGEALRYGAGFALAFAGTVFAAGLLAWAARKLVEVAGLRPADRALGAMFGLVRGAVLALAVALVVLLTPLKAAGWWTESVGAAVATVALQGLKPVLPQPLGQYLPG
ncbi:CvpA family protein [Ramlibacter tataouinensis]|uniref:Candidate membrane protein distantly related to colicin V production protein n=1 Tax=Ramlibacter tataouinensis (strain ATCC BAA-407 / DSM 14655 / LMG 21543 / TTB310) TaxID=365046 RepID=F5Y0D1_RAMTT|nr:CvpA family protein [Ramlibacter tataouinensis]AEG92153.1 candidate membrane protein distantly related to colicin V production protein [Ramlibacter tataouinensis TTB310]